MSEPTITGPVASDVSSEMTISDMVQLIRARLKVLTIVPLAAGLTALAASYLIPPSYTAATTFLPPQQAQSGAALALASLGPLAGLAGNAAGLSSSGDRYVSLMQSVTVSDRIIGQFKLLDVYNVTFGVDARKKLANNARFRFSKRDGLVTVEVDDTSPQRAADMANRYVEELRRLTGTLDLTEAQQRRAFFERHLKASREQLAQAQQALESSGLGTGALKAEPKAAAEAYARLRAEATAAELRLTLARGSMAESTPEVRQQLAVVSALRDQLALAERATEPTGGPGYVGKYREFKYREALFEIYARQFEVARADESRESALIQIVDPATPPERKSSPQRAVIAIMTTLAAALLLAVWVFFRHATRSKTGA